MASLLACCALLRGGVARGQAAEDPGRADALFKEAQACMDRGEWVCACERFERSMEAGPSVSTQLNLAKCRDHDGKPTLAVAAVEDALRRNRTATYADEARRAKLEQYAYKMLAELELRVARVRFAITNPPAGMEVRCDGERVPAAALGEPRRVDPGTHEIVVQAPSYDAERRTLTILAGQEREVTFVFAKQAPSSLPVPAIEPPPPNLAQPPQEPSSPPRQSRRVAGLALGGIGIATLGVAGALGIATLVKNGLGACQPPVQDSEIPACDAQRHTARGLQAAGIVTAGLGGAALGAGLALFLTAPRAPSSSQGTSRVTWPAWTLFVHPGGASVAWAF
jgi:hypothetical protein